MFRFAFLAFALSLSACAHVVTEDYDQYLVNNKGTALPAAKVKAVYSIDPSTKSHEYKFSSAMAGMANSWVVKFGDLLRVTLKSEDVQKAFGGIEEVNGAVPAKTRLIEFLLVDYQFRDKMAIVKMNITVKYGDKSILQKTYEAKGNSQGGKMFWGGAMGMKNAVHQSTKFAADKILTDFINDYNAVK